MICRNQASAPYRFDQHRPLHRGIGKQRLDALLYVLEKELLRHASALRRGDYTRVLYAAGAFNLGQP
jgi:hypothetical protein